MTNIYNVLEKMRAEEKLSTKEQGIAAQAEVHVLRQLHDQIDAAVFGAYGLSPTLSDADLLARLVALNAQRHDEEERGQVRWLRPSFQSPGSLPIQPVLPPLSPRPRAAPQGSVAQEAWPTQFPDQLRYVRARLARQSTAATVSQLLLAFQMKQRQSRELERTLESLEALGIAVSYEEGGERRWRGVAV